MRRSAPARIVRRLRDGPSRFVRWCGPTARIARWEVFRSAATVDRRTAVALLGVLLVAGLAGAAVVEDGSGLEDGTYTVGVDADSTYGPVVAHDDRLTRETTTYEAFVDGETDADVYVGQRGHVEHDGTNTGEAAYDAFRDAVRQYNEDRMAAESDERAAYPVTVTIDYRERGGAATAAAGEGSDGSDSGGGDGGEGGTDTGGDGGSTGGEGDGSDGSTGDGGAGDGSTAGERTGGGAGGGPGVPNLGPSMEDRQDVGTPGTISPPFPFESLLLAFLFIVPMNFVIQAYGSTIIDERVKRRGELLLVAPVSAGQIVAGKTLPYLLALVGIVLAITLVVGGGPLSVLATIPIALLFLAATFAGAMLARSFKELTFVTVTISVVLTSYAFVPAIFTDVEPIALISPLTLVVMDLHGGSVTVGQYLFSTGPFVLASAVLFHFGLGSYREEDMFAQKSIPSKALDVLAGKVRSYRSVAVCTILFFPFVFAGELLAVSLLFVLPIEYALPALLVVAAAIEEAAKSVHVYAGFARSRFEATLSTAAAVGAASGIGFFAGEKLTHLVQFVGLPDLSVGEAVFGPALSLGPVGVALFFLPLALHVFTAVVSAVGASEGRTRYAAAFVVATLLHASYNAGVIAVAA